MYSVCVLLCFVDPILGNLTVQGRSLSQGTWGCRILTLHLNYISDLPSISCLSFLSGVRGQREHCQCFFLSWVSARPYESCKIFKGRPCRNAFSKLVHRQYKSIASDRFCPAVVIPLNPEGMGIGEWVILFSENFEGIGMGMGMGMGNSKKLCA